MNFNGKSNAEVRHVYRIMSRDRVSPYEYKLESEFRRTLSAQDYRDLNAQSRRYKNECGECTTRMATEQEMRAAERVRPYQEIKFEKDVEKSEFNELVRPYYLHLQRWL